MNYDEQREAEHKRNAEVKAKIETALKLIPGFEIIPEPEGDQWDCRVQAIKAVDGPNAVKLWASFSAGYGDKRIHVSGTYPRNCKGEYIRVYYSQEERAARKAQSIPEYNYGEVEQPKITVSPDKTPEQISKDIIRRVLPGLFDYHARVMARIKADNDYHGSSESTLKEIKLAFDTQEPSKHEIENKQFSCYIDRAGEEYGSRIEVKASRKEVDLEIHNIRASEAVMIIRSLKELRGLK